MVMAGWCPDTSGPCLTFFWSLSWQCPTLEIGEELNNVETQCISLRVGLSPAPTPPHYPQWPVLAPELVAMDASPEPGPMDLRGPVLGYKESSALPFLTCSTVPSFPPSQLQDPEHTKAENKG